MAAELCFAREQAPGRPLAANLLVPFAKRSHVEACIRAKVDAVVLFADFAPEVVARLRQAGILVLHQVGTVPQAKRALHEGADGLIAQGAQAGGHVMGTRPALETLSRIQETAGGRPVLLAGGVWSAEQTAAALDAGATAVHCGSRFLLTEECKAHPAYKARAVGAPRTVLTELFGLGWPLKHRVVPNAATERWGDRRAIHALNRASVPIVKRLPTAAVGRLTAMQRPALPLYGPVALLDGMDDRLIEATPLYAGACVKDIQAIVPAQEAVKLLTPA
jgi:NAD(P)H-dependent flavin oxidoreductase YrpB (nitropropane dioxygenase family)